MFRKFWARSISGGKIGGSDDSCKAGIFYDTIRYDSVYLTCSKKLTGSQLSPLPQSFPTRSVFCMTYTYGFGAMGHHSSSIFAFLNISPCKTNKKYRVISGCIQQLSKTASTKLSIVRKIVSETVADNAAVVLPA